MPIRENGTCFRFLQQSDSGASISDSNLRGLLLWEKDSVLYIDFNAHTHSVITKFQQNNMKAY